jgi:protein-disulfide isomerase
LHPAASPAAYASVCAAKQNRFRGFYDIAFDHQDSVGKTPWTILAFRAGVGDTAAFGRCLRDSTSLGAVKADYEAAKRLKVDGTPTVLVNQWRFRGGPSTAILDSVVRAELRKAQ